jgi:hypothetical protein
LKLADRRVRLGCYPEQAGGVLAKEQPGLRECSISGRPIEEPLTKLVLEPPHCLADRRLRPVELSGGF